MGTPFGERRAVLLLVAAFAAVFGAWDIYRVSGVRCVEVTAAQLERGQKPTSVWMRVSGIALWDKAAPDDDAKNFYIPVVSGIGKEGAPSAVLIQVSREHMQHGAAREAAAYEGISPAGRGIGSIIRDRLRANGVQVAPSAILLEFATTPREAVRNGLAFVGLAAGSIVIYVLLGQLRRIHLPDSRDVQLTWRLGLRVVLGAVGMLALILLIVTFIPSSGLSVRETTTMRKMTVSVLAGTIMAAVLTIRIRRTTHSPAPIAVQPALRQVLPALSPARARVSIPPLLRVAVGLVLLLVGIAQTMESYDSAVSRDAPTYRIAVGFMLLGGLGLVSAVFPAGRDRADQARKESSAAPAGEDGG